MNVGHALALRQLEEFVAEANGLIEIVGSGLPHDQDMLAVIISINCEHIESSPDGLQFNGREQFHVLIDKTYPLQPPSVLVTHNRFVGTENVVWGRLICLYRSVEAEWDWTSGISGFLARLDCWMRDAARGEFNIEGVPIHPPLAHADGDSHCIVITQDIPWMATRTAPAWAYLQVKNDRYAEIIAWSEDLTSSEGLLSAPVFFLPKFTHYEFPENIGILLETFSQLGYLEPLRAALNTAVRNNKAGSPLYIIIAVRWEITDNAPTSDLHFVAWQIPTAVVHRMNMQRGAADAVAYVVGRNQIVEWQQRALEWCRVIDHRECVVKRRDVTSPCAWFAGRSVAVWGCGALGGYIAEFLVRAGVRKIVLYDNDTVDPGILVRQVYVDTDVPQSKVDALQHRLTQIRPGNVEVVKRRPNVVRYVAENTDWSEDVDVIIDTTASRAVLGAVEAQWNTKSSHPSILSLAIGSEATRGMVVVTHGEHAGGPQHVLRRAKIELLRGTRYTAYAEEFFPAEPPVNFFMPERGCSSPTFMGSAADCAALAGMLLNCGAKALSSMPASGAAAYCVTLPHAIVQDSEAVARFEWNAETLLHDKRHQFHIRISDSALKDIYAEINRSKRVNGAGKETGGVLFGQIDEALGIIWIDVASAPPPDSIHEVNRFVCGMEGIQEQNEALLGVTQLSTGFVGTWHTHPRSQPYPSTTDIQATATLFRKTVPSPSWTLVLIVGEVNGEWTPAAYVFHQDDVVQPVGAT